MEEVALGKIKPIWLLYLFGIFHVSIYEQIVLLFGIAEISNT